MVRKVLGAQALAALASGIALQASANPAPSAPAAPAAPAAPEAPAAQAAAAPAATTEAAAPAAAPAATADAPATQAAAPAATPSVAAAPADVTTFLQGQIATKDAALLAANIENAGLKARVTEFEASLGGLMDIARASLTNMRVALGGHKTDLSALTPSELLAQHASAAKDFDTQFVAGGVAAVDAAQKTNASAATALDSLAAARLAAVNASKRPR